MAELSDLPLVPVDESLDRFVRDLRSPTYAYNISRVSHITSTFLHHVDAIPCLYATIDLDDYFRAVYRFLLEQPNDQRPSANVLRRFWEDYSSLSRNLALDHCAKELRRLQEASEEASDDYEATLRACLRGEVTAESPQYQAAFAAQKKASARVREFRNCSDDAAASLAIVDTHGVYWGPEWGNSPLVNPN